MDQNQQKKEGSVVAKEFFLGFLAIALGSYNLASQLGYLKWNFEVPQMIGNILLVLVGLILWITAFRLWKYRFHTRRMF